MHYQGLDRRLDEWVDEGRVLREQSPKAAAPAAGGEFGRRRATRNMKRKMDEINHVQSAADEEMEKEHEESTKVKNIQTIEMGRFEVDARPHTWRTATPCTFPSVHF